MSYSRSLQSVLKEKNPVLHSKLLEIKKLANPLLSYTMGAFPYFTPHGFSHSEQVEENLNWLIPDEIKSTSFNEWEIFFMIVAAWMHDWGMVCKPGEQPEEVRKVHHVRTEQNFETLYDKLLLDKHQAIIIGRIARGHRVENLHDSKYDPIVYSNNFRIDVRFLTALVRIADECDMTYNRVPELIYFSLNPEGVSEEHFKKHLSVGGVGKENHKIVFYGIAYDPKGSKTLRLLQEKLQKEVNHVKGILADKKIILEHVEAHIDARGFIDKPISFRLDERKITDLLIGKSIYSEPDVAIRELIQNSIDACRFHKCLQKDTKSQIRLYKENDNLLIIEDNGFGMDFEKAKNFLSTKGFSYYTSPEFDKHKNDIDFEPISRWGLGILSCFLIANSLEIETKTSESEPCKFFITDVGEGWRFEKGTLSTPGTRIKLTLNSKGKNLDLEKTIRHYIKSSTIPIFVGKDSATPINFDWNLKDPEVQQLIESNSITNAKVSDPPFEFENSDLKIKMYDSTAPLFDGLLIANQGVFVGTSFGIPTPNLKLILLDTKKDILDLDISRSHINYNSPKFEKFLEKWVDVLLNFANNSMATELKKYKENIITKFFLINFTIHDYGISPYVLSSMGKNNFNELNPAIQKFLLDYKFSLVFARNELKLLSINEISEIKPATIYIYEIDPPFDEDDNLPDDHTIGIQTILNKMTHLKNDEILLFLHTRYSDKLTKFIQLLKEKIRSDLTIKEIKINDLFVDEIEVTSTKLEKLLPANGHFANIPKIFESCMICTKPYKLKSDAPGFVMFSLTVLGMESKPHTKIIETGEIVFDKNDIFIKKLLAKEEEILSSERISKSVTSYFKMLALKFLGFPKSIVDIIINEKEIDILDLLNMTDKIPPHSEREGSVAKLLLYHNPAYNTIINEQANRNSVRLARFLFSH